MFITVSFLCEEKYRVVILMIWTLYNISLPPPQASKDEIILNQPKWTLLRKPEFKLFRHEWYSQTLYSSEKIYLPV